MFQYFDTGLKIYVAGIITYPIAKYIIVKFGAVLWQDIKVLAYSVWDKVKAKV